MADGVASFRSLLSGLSKTFLGWRLYSGFSEVPSPLQDVDKWDAACGAILEAVGQTRLPGVEVEGSECGLA